MTITKGKKVIAFFLMLALAVTLVPVSASAATKSKNVKTYVFFGSDSRLNNDGWKSINGGKIKTDKSGTEGTPRSDVIMLLKVNKKKKTIDVLSIYRDTYLDVSGKGKDFGKANRAYSKLGPAKAVKALEKNLDIKIDGYVATNFKGVGDVIEALGGVKVKVDGNKVVKPYRTSKLKTVPQVMNRLIDEHNRIYQVKPKVKHVKKTGKQKLRGLQAVAYARVRYTEGSDMMRTVRQRTVLTAMSKKYRASKAVKKKKVRDSIYSLVDTSLSKAQFDSLLKQAASYKIKKKQGFPYYKTSLLIKTKKESGGNAWVMVPCDLTKNVTILHKRFYGEKNYKPSKTVKKYSKKIKKKTKKGYYQRNKQYDNKY